MLHVDRVDPGHERDAEGGASLVEFALLLPIFMMLVLAMLTGGQAYNRDLTLTSASRETARYGATLPVTTMDGWLNDVGEVAIDAATGEADGGVDGRRICVAYVHPDGTTANDQNSRKVVTGTATFSATSVQTGVNATCYSDGRPNTERRVQVLIERDSKLEALVFSYDVHLKGQAISRFEATA